MSWELLPVNYTDAVWNGLKKYIEVDNGDGSVSFQDVTQYTNKENSFFGSYDANRMNEAINRIMSMVENGTDLYEAFTNYFNEQKVLFESASNTELSEYSTDLDALRSNATTRFNSFNTYVTNLQQQGDEAIETIKTDYSEEIADFETNQENAFNIWFQAIRDKMSGDVATNLQNQIDQIVNNKVLFDITCPEVTIGATVTVTDGTVTKTATVDSTLRVSFGFPNAGVYTLSDSFTGSSVQVDALHYGLYPVNLQMGIIRVAVPDGFVGKRITVTNGTDTYSRLVAEGDTVLTFGAPDLGEWTVSNNFTQETFTVDVEDYITYNVAFHIATLTVTCDTSYEGYDVSVTNGTLAYTQTIPDTGVLTFYIPVFGNWTISNTMTSDTQTVNVQAYSTYNAQFGIVGIKVTCGNSAFVGKTITITKGTFTQTQTVPASLEVTFTLNTLGTYVITNNLTSASVTVEATEYRTYEVDVNLAVINITFADARFEGQTVTCGDETKTIPASLNVSFSVDLGTYTITNSLTSASLTVEATDYIAYPVTISLVTINVTFGDSEFEGQTVTCGSETKTIPDSLSVSFSVDLGTYTVSNSLTGATDTVEATEYTTYNVGFRLAHIIVTCDTESFLSTTITCTNGTDTLSRLVGTGLTVTFPVDLGNWTLHNPVTDRDEKAIAVTQYTDYTFTMKELEIVSWSTGTDEQIVAMIEAADDGSIDLYDDAGWRVGDERQITLSAMSATGVGESHVSQTVTFVLMNRGGKTLADGTTECNFIVGMKNMLANGTTREGGYMNSSDTNSGGWEACARRTWCNNVFREAIPSTIRPIFKQHLNITANGSGSTTATSTDYFALPSEKEIFGSISYANSTAEASNTQFEWYQTAANRIKKAGNSGSADNWWERSPYSGYSGRFCFVDSNGYANINYASYGYGLAPFGCI